MTVSVIPFIFPFLWALAVAAFWRYKMKEPINHWIVCILIFAVNFFWFAWMFVIFLLIMIFKSGIFYKKEDLKDEEGANE